jgi:3-oxoadipate enol-lactonase
MAFVEHDGASLHWHALGEGEPLVLIMGLGCCSAMWFRLAPRLARKHRVIMFDNRGVGQTTVRFGLVHRVATMAADVAAVLDAAGESSAHVLGLSMGGMIARQFALDFPARIRSLVLAATNCGSSRAILADAAVWRLLFDKGSLSPEESLSAMQPYTYAERTPAARIEEDSVVRLAYHPMLRGYQAQLYGLIGWTSYGRLPELKRPTPILHGKEDQLIPPANGRLLASRIAGARLVELDDASHWLHTDQLDATVELVQNFIARNRGAPS